MMIDPTSLGQFDFGTNWSFTPPPPPPDPSQMQPVPESRWVAPPSKEATARYIAQADPRTSIPLLEQMGYQLQAADSWEDITNIIGDPSKLSLNSPLVWVIGGGILLWLLTHR